jgi:dihydropteroate synthase
MTSDLEIRLNPRVVKGAVILERLTAGERRLTGGGPVPEGVRIPGPVGELLRQTWKRHRTRRFRVPYPGGALVCGPHTHVMGILNVTPDSFSDGGSWSDPDRAVQHARRMVEEGASIVDVGGESTRPGALPVPADQEKERVLPVVERLARDGILVSIDTSKARVAEAAFRAGAKVLNDVTALRGDPGMARAAARAGAAVLLMHMKGTPRSMQRNPRYRDVVAEILRFFRENLRIALRAGIARDRILVDPGIGFGKRPEHNVEILRRLGEFRSLGCALAIGTSRKSFIGHVLGRPVNERLHGTAATVAAAILRGAHVVRVHDVREMVDVVRMTDVLK